MSIKKLLLIVVGIISIGMSVSCFKMEVGNKVYRSAYGGDAYTGIQNAGAETGTNVFYLNQIMAKGFGSILLVAGLGMIVLGLPHHTKIATNDTKQKTLELQPNNETTSQEENTQTAEGAKS